MLEPHEAKSARPWMTRLGWLVLFWVGGVATLALVAYLLRVVMNWAGFSS